MFRGFAVLPDDERARDVPAVLAWPDAHVLYHDSGRPWLVGDWTPEEILDARSGAARVVVLGHCPWDAARLAGLAARVRSVADLDLLVRALPGSAHVVAAVAGRVRVQGSASGLRRVFHARRDGITVAADRADVLARLTGAAVDDDVLAAQLTSVVLPPPVGEWTPWRGVRALPPDRCLLLEPEGTHTEAVWWRPPEPVRKLSAGADRVRSALETAVASPSDGRVSADLSGGFDSTSLCFLAARTHPDLLTARFTGADAANEDAHFAALAAAHLPGAEHWAVPPGAGPSRYADIGAAVDPEQPVVFGRESALVRWRASALAASGSRCHLAGHGADEIFHAPHAYLHPLARRRPLVAWRHLRAHRAARRWSWRAIAGELADRGDLADWWTDAANGLTGPPPRPSAPLLGWGLPLRAPAWLTADALASARRTFHTVAESVRPLAADRAGHLTLAAIRTSAPQYRLLARLHEANGVPLRLPFLDDRVVEAALAVRPEDRASPWRYKPVLAEAMAGIVPAPILDRRTKGDFTADTRAGFRRHLPALLSLFEESRLADRGLIDPGRLRATLLAPQRDNSALFLFDSTLAAELWLRSVS
ncbi:asparagine synthase-related protein [Streptomyces sp. NPDC048290]|uniref:asparagine synthase-related protein n=1 Tax=Streptomyces sp. NPDC048290 TaxID=3155811 RepID=UPI003447EA20